MQESLEGVVKHFRIMDDIVILEASIQEMYEATRLILQKCKKFFKQRLSLLGMICQVMATTSTLTSLLRWAPFPP